MTDIWKDAVDGRKAGAADRETETAGRRLALDVHRRLRAMILNGELAPGAVLLQAEMARKLGVSRTPMREAFRLLQEEGLIDARPDQRARVRGMDPEDLDEVYGARILLESLGLAMTVRSLTAHDLERMEAALEQMRAHAGADDPEPWHRAHREFHALTTRSAGAQLGRMIASLAEHSERYIRLAQLGVSGSWSKGLQDHETLLAALRDKDEAAATRVLTRHLARTALSVMADVAPEHEPTATRTALRVAGNGPSPK